MKKMLRLNIENEKARIENILIGPDFFTYILEIEPQTFQAVVNSSERDNQQCNLIRPSKSYLRASGDLPPGCKPLR